MDAASSEDFDLEVKVRMYKDPDHKYSADEVVQIVVDAATQAYKDGYGAAMGDMRRATHETPRSYQ